MIWPMLITPAAEAGYTVTSSVPFRAETKDVNELLFAGTLDACLEYIRDKLYNAELTRNREDVP